MKTLKQIVEGILGDLDADLDRAAALNELSNHGNWGAEKGETYELNGDTLSILSVCIKPWICHDNKFWELIKSAGIKRIESNCALRFLDHNFDINGISINTPQFVYIENCNAIIKNCSIKGTEFFVQNGKLTLDGANIECVDKYNRLGLAAFKQCVFNQKNTSINCERVDVEYNKFKDSDWGNYIESLGVVKILPSGKIKILNEKVELNENFVPPTPSNATEYRINVPYTKNKGNIIIFEKSNSSNYMMRFKNDWIGTMLKIGR